MDNPQNKTQKKTVTAVVSPEIHEALTDAAYQLRETQTKVASAAIIYYIDQDFSEPIFSCFNSLVGVLTVRTCLAQWCYFVRL